MSPGRLHAGDDSLPPNLLSTPVFWSLGGSLGNRRGILSPNPSPMGTFPRRQEESTGRWGTSSAAQWPESSLLVLTVPIYRASLPDEAPSTVWAPHGRIRVGWRHRLSSSGSCWLQQLWLRPVDPPSQVGRGRPSRQLTPGTQVAALQPRGRGTTAQGRCRTEGSTDRLKARPGLWTDGECAHARMDTRTCPDV